MERINRPSIGEERRGSRSTHCCHHAILWSDLARLSVSLPTLLYQGAVRLVICTRMTRSGLGSGVTLLSLSLPLKPSFEMLVTHQVSGRPGVVNLLSFEMLMRLIRKSMSMFQTFAVTLPPGSSPALVKNDWDGPLWH